MAEMFSSVPLFPQMNKESTDLKDVVIVENTDVLGAPELSLRYSVLAARPI